MYPVSRVDQYGSWQFVCLAELLEFSQPFLLGQVTLDDAFFIWDTLSRSAININPECAEMQGVVVCAVISGSVLCASKIRIETVVN